MAWEDFGWQDMPAELAPRQGESLYDLAARIRTYDATHPDELTEFESARLEAFGQHIYNKAIADAAGGGAATPDADASTKGKIQLAGDLTGTAASPQIAAGAVGTNELAAGAVTAAKAAADIATQVELDNEATARIAADAALSTSVNTKADAASTATALNARLLWRGAWGSGTAYALNDVVSHGGRIWVVTTAHTSSSAITLSNFMTDGGLFRGAWQATTAYKANDLVTNSGSLYFANTDFTSGASFSGSNWTLVSAGGSGTGATVHYGAGAPLNSLGANGDSYVDTTNGRLYGPKASGVWPGTYIQLGAGASTFDGTTFGTTALDTNGDPVITFQSVWGIDATTGDPYYDSAGATAGEDALLLVNPADGTLNIVQPEGATP